MHFLLTDLQSFKIGNQKDGNCIELALCCLDLLSFVVAVFLLKQRTGLWKSWWIERQPLQRRLIFFSVPLSHNLHDKTMFQICKLQLF